MGVKGIMARPTTNLQYIDRASFLRNYWKYYMMLEGKLIQISNYVHIHKDNYKTFSNEFASLQYSIGAETDSFFKVYCGYQHVDETNIADYAVQILNGRYNDIVNQEISIIGFDMTIQPFKDWDVSRPKQSLSWWLAYDNVKHSRYDNMKGANLENVINLLGGLHILEMKYLKEAADLNNETDCPDVNSKLFDMKGWNSRCHTLEGAIFEAKQ